MYVDKGQSKLVIVRRKHPQVYPHYAAMKQSLYMHFHIIILSYHSPNARSSPPLPPLQIVIRHPTHPYPQRIYPGRTPGV